MSDKHGQFSRKPLHIAIISLFVAFLSLQYRCSAAVKSAVPALLLPLFRPRPCREN